jgi:hypothetical protein
MIVRCLSRSLPAARIPLTGEPLEQSAQKQEWMVPAEVVVTLFARLILSREPLETGGAISGMDRTSGGEEYVTDGSEITGVRTFADVDGSVHQY